MFGCDLYFHSNAYFYSLPYADINTLGYINFYTKTDGNHQAVFHTNENRFSICYGCSDSYTHKDSASNEHSPTH